MRHPSTVSFLPVQALFAGKQQPKMNTSKEKLNWHRISIKTDAIIMWCLGAKYSFAFGEKSSKEWR